MKSATWLNLPWVLLTISSVVSAEPRDTLWVEDLHLEDPGNTETALAYEYQGTDSGALQEGIDLLSLELSAGVIDRLEAVPRLRFRQFGQESLRIDTLGGTLRVRALGDAEDPHVVVSGGYFNDLDAARDHWFKIAGAGRYAWRGLFVTGDLQLTTLTGEDVDTALETRAALAVGYELALPVRLSGAIESFYLLPLVAERVSDPVFGSSGSSGTFYVGPTLSARTDSAWFSLSAVTGYFVHPGADILMKAAIGVSH